MPISISNKETSKLLRAIDDSDNYLSRAEVDFVADLIDRKVKKFTDREKEKVNRVHQRRVINGRLDI